MLVRVVDYAAEDGRANPEVSRLFTTLLDPDEVSAVDLAGAYRQRWEIESTFDELKTRQRGPRTVLRSRSPQLVLQEIWGHLCCHYAIRTLMAATAAAGGLEPDRVSFVAALRITRQSLAGVQAVFPPEDPAPPRSGPRPGVGAGRGRRPEGEHQPRRAADHRSGRHVDHRAFGSSRTPYPPTSGGSGSTRRGRSSTPAPPGPGEPLAVALRAGNAGSDSADDHIAVTRAALAQLPGHAPGTRPGRRVLIRVDGAGSSKEYLHWLTRRRLSDSVGSGLPTGVGDGGGGSALYKR